VATLEDDEASRKRVQEAVWTWTGRIVVLAVVFIFGVYTGWVEWGAGDEGAVNLRTRLPEVEGQLGEQKKRVIDCEGKLTVVQGRLDEIQKAMQRATAGAGGGGAAQ